ncbi:unnamed protein product [Blepharisma stoltei]|uniref:Uncharacterized protein n=1 Tax=Blepharisma stoltei TaxID=1481888 RepID=A0AAU9IQL4_9CILI|nr:unnamed protein product [Blepharisma stoltei]
MSEDYQYQHKYNPSTTSQVSPDNFYNVISVFNTPKYDKSTSKEYSFRDRKTLLITELEELDSKFSEFENVKSKFPPLRLPKKRKKLSKSYKKSSTERKKKEEISPNRSYRIPKSLLPTEPPNFVVGAISTHHLGPGSYSFDKTDKLVGGIISSGPRFEYDFQGKVDNFFSHKRAVSEKPTEVSFRNKDLSQFSPENKIVALQSKARVNEIRLQIQKRTKELLLENEKSEREQNYLTKLTKLDWRMKKPEMTKIAGSWIILAGIFSVLSILRYKKRHRKILRYRSKHHLFFLYWLFRFIGKIRLRVLNYRRSKLAKALKKNFKTILRWFYKRKETFRITVDYSIERALLCNYMFELMARFRLKQLKIQRKIRQFLDIKRARFTVLRLMWEKNASIVETKKSFKSKNQKLKGKISTQIREEYIKKYYTEQCKAYISQLSEYHKTCEIIKQNLEKANKPKELYDYIFEKKEDSQPTYPDYPVFKIYSNSHAMRVLIVQAFEQSKNSKISTQAIKEFLDRSKNAGTPLRFNEFYLTLDPTPKNKT